MHVKLFLHRCSLMRTYVLSWHGPEPPTVKRHVIGSIGMYCVRRLCSRHASQASPCRAPSRAPSPHYPPPSRLFDSLLHLALRLARRRLQIGLQFAALGLDLSLCSLEALIVHVDAADLCCADAKDEEVYAREGNVLGANDKAPAGPDGACAHEGKVLGEGEGFGGAREVRGAGEHHAPFHDWGPKVHRLGPNRAVPELLEASWFRPSGGVDPSAGIGALEEGSEGVEDAGARTEGHDGVLCVRVCVSLEPAVYLGMGRGDWNWRAVV